MPSTQLHGAMLRHKANITFNLP